MPGMQPVLMHLGSERFGSIASINLKNTNSMQKSSGCDRSMPCSSTSLSQHDHDGAMMPEERRCIAPLAFLRLLTWLSPTFPIGSYSYSHGLEWAIDAGDVLDRISLVDWLEADLCYGSGRNEASFFVAAWRSTREGDRPRLFEIAELAAAFRGT